MNYLVYILLFIFFRGTARNLLDRVASVVENKIVLMSDVVLAANAVAAQQQINPNTILQHIKNFRISRESMVEQLLIIEMAEQDSVEILDKDIDKALNQQIDNIIAQSGSKELAEAALGKKISDFKRSYRDDMRGKLLAEKYTSSLTASISVSRGDVIDFFNTYKDSIPSFPTLYKTHHILLEIKPSEESIKNSLNKAKEIRNKILNQELSFADAAKTYSADPGSKNQGGNLGYVPRGTFVQEFDRVVFTVEKNVLTEPVKTQYGYHLIEVLDRTGEKVLARHILIRTETTESDKKKTYDTISNIKNNIKNYDDFYMAAADFSDDKTSNTNGGFLGMIDLDYYQVPELKKEISTITKKTVSNPIATDFGYHLIWVDEIKEGGPPTLESNWLELEEMTLNKKKSDWYQAWIQKIKSQFYIKRNPLTYPQISS